MFYQKRQEKSELAISRPGHSCGLRLQIRKRRASRGHSPAGSGEGGRFDHLEMRNLTGGGTSTIQLTGHGNKPEMTINIEVKFNWLANNHHFLEFRQSRSF